MLAEGEVLFCGAERGGLSRCRLLALVLEDGVVVVVGEVGVSFTLVFDPLLAADADAAAYPVVLPTVTLLAS